MITIHISPAVQATVKFPHLILYEDCDTALQVYFMTLKYPGHIGQFELQEFDRDAQLIQ